MHRIFKSKLNLKRMQHSKPVIRRSSLVVILAIAVILLASWTIPLTSSVIKGYLYDECDTLPAQVNQKLAQLNRTIEKLDIAKTELNKYDLNKDVSSAIERIDIESLQKQIEEAGESANIALKNIDEASLKQQIENSIAKIDVAKINRQVEQVIEGLRPQIEQSIENAKLQVERAKSKFKGNP